jgi:hypothetical protein
MARVFFNNPNGPKANQVMRRPFDDPKQDRVLFESPPIYYGKSSQSSNSTLITESTIKSFQKLRGLGGANLSNIGLPNGRLFTFPSTSTQYYYFCLPIIYGSTDPQTQLGPNIPNDGSKVIYYVVTSGDTFPSAFCTDSGFFYYKQKDPNSQPDVGVSQMANYALTTVDGVPYRVYRLNATGGSGNINNKIVYSF